MGSVNVKVGSKPQGAKKMSKIPIYEEIYGAWQRDPENVNQSELCRQRKVNVGTYMAWKRTHKGGKDRPMIAATKGPSPASKISIEIPVAEIVAMLQSGKPLVIPRQRLLTALTSIQKQTVATALGMSQLKDQADGNNHGLPSNEEETLA